MEPSNWGRLRCFKSPAVRIRLSANDRQGFREKPSWERFGHLFLWGRAGWWFRALVVIIICYHSYHALVIKWYSAGRQPCHIYIYIYVINRFSRWSNGMHLGRRLQWMSSIFVVGNHPDPWSAVPVAKDDALMQHGIHSHNAVCFPDLPVWIFLIQIA